MSVKGIFKGTINGKKVKYMDNDLLIETVKNPVYQNRTNLKQILSLNIYKILQEMEKKILNGRIKNPEAEKIRLEYIKAYINGCNCFKSLTDNANSSAMYDSEVIKKYLDTPQEMQDIEADDLDMTDPADIPPIIIADQ